MATPTNQSGDPSYVRVKVCGVTSVEDAHMALVAGADAIGVNMVSGPRRVPADLARRIISAVAASKETGEDRPRPMPVLLVELSEGRLSPDVEDVLGHAQVLWLQLYGEVGASDIRSLVETGRHPVLVARVSSEDFAARVNETLRACGTACPTAVLLDAYHRDKLGGTGETFRWSWVTEARVAGDLDGWPLLILAGGLNPSNVARAVRAVRPWAVDVSSGVEASPGRKDPAKVAAFIRNVRSALSESPECDGDAGP
ncbi:MAG: phosphoribosylanthranilate isomerase [Phycisphaerae bacterium]|nr:phosphoribosylanthranilate isomerase [Phycisphaerae bacterium]